MNDNTTPLPTIADRAMLVDLDISMWRDLTTDRAVTEHVHADYDADADSGRYQKRLLPHDPLTWKAVKAARTALQKAHDKLTLPWARGQRIITKAAFVEYGREMAKLRRAFDEAVSTFLADYPEQMRVALDKLGRMADATDYPSVEKLRPLFGVSIEFSPVPQAGDFRVTMADEHVAMIREQIDGVAAKRVDQAQRALWDRLVDVVEQYAHSLRVVQRRSEEKETDPSVRVTVRESLLDNVNRMAELARTLNIGEDPRIDAIRDAIVTTIGAYDRDALRNSEHVRKDAIAKADALADRMRAFLPGARS